MKNIYILFHYWDSDKSITMELHKSFESAMNALKSNTEAQKVLDKAVVSGEFGKDIGFIPDDVYNQTFRIGKIIYGNVTECQWNNEVTHSYRFIIEKEII